MQDRGHVPNRDWYADCIPAKSSPCLNPRIERIRNERINIERIESGLTILQLLLKERNSI
jgi:hypothetical protein